MLVSLNIREYVRPRAGLAWGCRWWSARCAQTREGCLKHTSQTASKNLIDQALWIAISLAVNTPVMIFRFLLMRNNGSRCGSGSGTDESTLFAADQTTYNRSACRTTADVDQFTVTTVKIGLFVIISRGCFTPDAGLSGGRSRSCYRKHYCENNGH